MKVNRTRYIGTSVVLTSATKCAPYRERALTLLNAKFLAHKTVHFQVMESQKRRNEIYRKVCCDLKMPAATMTGTSPIDYKRCFTVGGANCQIDDEAVEDMFDCVLNIAEINSPSHIFTMDSAERFKMAAFRAIQYNRTHIGFALHRLEEEEHVFELANKQTGDRLFREMKKIIPESHTIKDEIVTMAYSLTHAASDRVDAVYMTNVEALTDSGAKKKIALTTKRVLKLGDRDCPEVNHLSETYF